MKKKDFLITSCHCCRFYETEGRRGGNCQLLNVQVAGEWSACALGQHPFAPEWDNNLDQVVQLERTLSLDCVQGSDKLELVNQLSNVNQD